MPELKRIPFVVFAGEVSRLLVCKFLFLHRLYFQYSSRTNRYLDGAFLLEAPVKDIVIISDYRNSPEDKFASWTAIDSAVVVHVTPGRITGCAFEDTGQLRTLEWTT